MNQIKSSNATIDTIKHELSSLIDNSTFSSYTQFLQRRAYSVRNNINARHDKKIDNLRTSHNSPTELIIKNNWVVNLSKKPLQPAERSLLEKGPKFAPTPSKIPAYKDFVAEVEAAITRLPDESKDQIRTSTAAILQRASLPNHNNITKEEKKALHDIKKDSSRVIMKADKGNCFVVMDRDEYDNKMESLLADRNTYEHITRSPFRRIERELNAILLNLKKQQKIDESTYFKLRSTDGIPPAIRGSTRHHKEGHPLRPIVTCIGSALYNTSKFLTNILAPIQNRNGFSVPNSQNFSRDIADINILDDETMVSVDVVSLFTAIPVEKACNYIRKKLEDDSSLHSRSSLDIDDIICLLNFVLSNNYFIYNDNIYKQIHGCAMGSPVSPVKNAVAFFHDSLNSINPHISFTIEHESNGQLPFLDTLISRDNNKLNIDVYRKPTHTDRYLDFRSHHDREHKISTTATLLHRALKLPNSESGKAREIDLISITLQSNGYPPKVTADIIRKKSSTPPTPSPEELVGMFFSWADPMNSQSFAVLPYIKGITEPLTRILKSHDIRVTNKPIKTLQQEFPVPKFRPRVDDQCNVVYKIPCASCPWNYIGETKRSFSTRRKEHIRNTKQCAKGSNVAKHAWTLDHAIDFENAEIIAQFRYIKIQPKTIDLGTRLRGLNYTVCGVYSLEPRCDVYCFRLNFKISKLGF
ncbi:hypothetical protein ACROYT_G033624 [Oculina patagonica]